MCGVLGEKCERDELIIMNITNSEWKIMKLLWEQPMTITQLTKALMEENSWKKNTVITLLKRMEGKGTVYYEQGVKAKLFFPKCKKEEAMAEETGNFLNKVFDGNRSLMFSTVIKNSRMTEQEIDEICKMLNLQRKA